MIAEVRSNNSDGSKHSNLRWIWQASNVKLSFREPVQRAASIGPFARSEMAQKSAFTANYQANLMKQISNPCPNALEEMLAASIKSQQSRSLGADSRLPAVLRRPLGEMSQNNSNSA